MAPEEAPIQETTLCPGCGALHDEHAVIVVCSNCARRYPPSLLKAAGDPFDYALRLRSGEEIRFSDADIHGDYVTLTLMEHEDFMPPHEFPRGLDVRVSDIIWCADAPDGS